jgi:UPF0042 nucleotide-binding protein
MDVHLLFLETKTNTLVKRFSETPRHPLSDSRTTLPECIQMEREMLRDPRAREPYRYERLECQLVADVGQRFCRAQPCSTDTLFQSFGYKHGIRWMRIWFSTSGAFEPSLRITSTAAYGRDDGRQYLDASPMLLECSTISGSFWTTGCLFYQDNRNYLTVAIGCTGGRHRSVYLAEHLAKHFRQTNQVLIRHRELDT